MSNLLAHHTPYWNYFSSSEQPTHRLALLFFMYDGLFHSLFFGPCVSPPNFLIDTLLHSFLSLILVSQESHNVGWGFFFLSGDSSTTMSYIFEGNALLLVHLLGHFDLVNLLQPQVQSHHHTPLCFQRIPSGCILKNGKHFNWKSDFLDFFPWNTILSIIFSFKTLKIEIFMLIEG